jgi:anhydro-N-acetylmuramic acid kinase
MSSYSILGLMSGTSMDGLDIAHVTFCLSENKEWEYTVNHVETYPYEHKTLQQLRNGKNLSTIQILELDKHLGLLFANHINTFIKKNAIDKNTINAIASHGHTVHHRPDIGFTQQIGCGDTIAYETGIKVINDFRQKDVIAGGQGAPLVPIGDKLLFSKKADAFLNIGGFTNICIPSEQTIAFDICPGNLPLNEVVNELGLDFDDKGYLSSKGVLDELILNELNALEFYNEINSKSLGTEWLENSFTPIVNKIPSPKDRLRTITEHLSIQIAQAINQFKIKRLYITGGGAFNDFLITRLRVHTTCELIIPNTITINYKEAVVFAFLGVRFLRGEINCLSSVTGALKDTIGGSLHYS